VQTASPRETDGQQVLLDAALFREVLFVSEPSSAPHLALRGRLNALKRCRPADDPLIFQLAQQLREETAVYRAVAACEGLPLASRVRVVTAVLAADGYVGGEIG
jgi:hypothetical protein